MMSSNETFNNLLNLLQLNDEQIEISKNSQLLIDTDAKYIKDLKINVSNVLSNVQYLNQKEAAILGFCVMVNEKNHVLRESFTKIAKNSGATDQELSEAVSITSLMNTNNVYYRFKHFAKKEYYNTQPAGIKMSIMANPILGKELFELISLVISAINGCELCVTSHESKLINEGTSEAKILEGVKLGAILKGMITILD